MDSSLRPDPFAPQRSPSEFYVVSAPKLILMACLTPYYPYWYYRQWLQYRGERGLKWIPLLCGIAGPLLIYPLMKRIIMRSREKGLQPDCSALKVTLMIWIPYLAGLVWSYDSYTSNSSLSFIISLHFSLMVWCWIVPMAAMVKVQEAANACQGDELGRKNSTLTWANYLWIAISPVLGLFLVYTLAGLSITYVTPFFQNW
nr:hypothetical protein [uncultured Pseudomonas sp.]